MKSEIMPIEISKGNPNYFSEIPANSTQIKIEIDFSESTIKKCLLRLYNAPFMQICWMIEFDDKDNSKTIDLNSNKIGHEIAVNYCLEIEPLLIDLETGVIRAKIEF